MRQGQNALGSCRYRYINKHCNKRLHAPGKAVKDTQISQKLMFLSASLYFSKRDTY